MNHPHRVSWRSLAGAAAVFLLISSAGFWWLSRQRHPKPPATLRQAEQAVSLLYQARNDADYITLSTLLDPGVDLALPLTANSAIWGNVTVKKVQPGVRPAAYDAIRPGSGLIRREWLRAIERRARASGRRRP